MWWIYSILSASTQVLRNVDMKHLGHKLDEYINVWGRFTFLLPFALLYSFYKGIPEVQNIYWFYSLLSGVFAAISTVFLSKAFKKSDISISIAIWKSSAVISILILGIIFLNENITLIKLCGILVIIFGVYIFNVEKTKISYIEPIKMLAKEEGVKFAMLAGLTLGVTMVFFKKTILLADPFFPVFTNYLFASIVMLPLIITKSSKHFKSIPKYFWHFLLMGLLAAISTTFQNMAYELTITVYAEAVKQIEILLSLIMGMIFFKEHQKVKQILPGVIIILIGILIMIF